MITTITLLPYFYIATQVIDAIYFNQTLKNQCATLQIVYVPISRFCSSAELFYIWKICKNLSTHTIFHAYLKTENQSVTPFMQNKFSNYLTIQLTFHNLQLCQKITMSLYFATADFSWLKSFKDIMLAYLNL